MGKSSRRPPITKPALEDIDMRSWSKLQMIAAATVCAAPTLWAQGAAKTPDLSGVWNMKGSPQTRYWSWTFSATDPPMTPWAQERFNATKPSFGPRSFEDSNDPVNPTTLNSVGCFPPGVPRIYL